MDEKVRLVAALLAEEHSMTELCESFRMSRKTGYKWLLRYRQHGPQGLHELSRAPHRVRWAISDVQAEAILALRLAHPSWGPRSCGPNSCNAIRTKLGRCRAPLASCCAAMG